MNTLRKPWLAVGAALVLVNLVAPWTLQANLQAGVYRSDADSIAVGLFQIWALSVAGAIGLLIVAGAAIALRWVCARCPAAWLQDLCALLVGVGYAAALLYFTLWTLAWSVPHHGSIAACTALLTATVAWAAWHDLRTLRCGSLSSGSPQTSLIRTRTSMFG
jgi:hypothetical protein